MAHGNHSRARFGECDVCQRKRFKSNLKRRYGMTVEEYEVFEEKQKSLCAICKQPENARYFRRLCVDHDHETGKIRGLLCHMCNTGLGKFADDVELLRAATIYLEERF
jgi:hypothetical protein